MRALCTRPCSTTAAWSAVSTIYEGRCNVKLISSVIFKIPWDETWVSTYQAPVSRLGARGFGPRHRNWAGPGRCDVVVLLRCCWLAPAHRSSSSHIVTGDAARSRHLRGRARVQIPQHAGNSRDPELGTLGCSGQGVGLMSHLQLSWNHPPTCIRNMTWSVSPSQNPSCLSSDP